MALSIVAAVSMGRGFRIIATTPGLDLSLIYALNYASAHGLRWGGDFISTYGPYGYVLLTLIYVCTAQAEEYQWFVLLLLVLMVGVSPDCWPGSMYS